MNRIHPTLPPLSTPGVRPSHARGACFAIVLVMLVYALANFGPPPGWLTYCLTLAPLAVILLTSIARINDISNESVGAYWNVRRCGLILVALFGANIGVAPFGPEQDFPNWWRVVGVWGFALTWLTSPHQPPWPQYIWQRFRIQGDNHPCRRKTDDFDSNP